MQHQGSPEPHRTVAYVVNQYPKVSHTFIRREIEALEALGHRVVRFSIRPAPDGLGDPADVREAGRTRVVLDAGGLALLGATLRRALHRPLAFARATRLAAAVGRKSERGLLVHGAYLAEACLLARWLEEAGADHVHAHFGTNPATVAMLCRELGGPAWSFTVHGPEEFDKPGLIGLGEKIRRARFVVGVSSFGRSQLFRHAEADRWRDIHVVRCGVDRAFLDRPATPVPAARRLVCVGRLCEQKGQLLLVEAAAELARAGEAFDLVLVGDGELRAEIERRITALGLGGHVRITGWLDESSVKGEIEAARALVLPSFAEGLPVAIMEALALGRPVVSTFVAGIPELVESGADGWLVPAGSVEALAAALREVLGASPGELTRLGEEGRRRVRLLHDAGHNAVSLSRLVEGASGC